MLDATKNDLSFNRAKIDFEALKYVTEIAFGKPLESIIIYTEKLRKDYETSYMTGLKLDSGWLAEEAEKLRVAGETLDVLIGAEERQYLEIVNKPKVDIDMNKDISNGKEDNSDGDNA